ncbi:GNAT family N-acetyltransferase [Variovorax sp. PAMC26660]|uniref:GNAT family N-acetyltransferase n=1 Tax=Variovorax sp. PAMC26660 TaxID=2762322 RepID=UPI00164DD980|nr:GNAT family N-acetyltransferase [Variovorax sp. PAMC26660]QNK67786.1 GNAT family N-acetyltransferase [Variovorax sp. PAMC26660]
MSNIETLVANYRDAVQAAAVVDLLNAYASDPVGGGTPLDAAVREKLPAALAARPQAFSVLAFDGDTPVGLVNCIEGFSTFACQPLVNVHDVVVLPSHRGQRVAQKMFAQVEQEARRRGACKLTLEVLSGNAPALRTYEREGFTNYQLDPAFGSAVFLQKKL